VQAFGWTRFQISFSFSFFPFPTPCFLGDEDNLIRAPKVNFLLLLIDSSFSFPMTGRMPIAFYACWDINPGQAGGK
jgi:hypothetical protein